MFLKYSQAQKRIKTAGSGKPRATGMMKQTAAMMNVVPRMHRKVTRNIASKRLNSTHHRVPTASKRQELRPNTVIPFDPCENSNDSGLGFDQHTDYPTPAQPVLRFAEQGASWSEGLRNLKRRRIDIKLESDDANDNFSFPRNVRQTPPSPPGAASRLPTTSTTFASPSPSFSSSSTSSSPTALFSSVSRDGKVQLQIVCQPEQQHRARYQTEGSRGAVKDRSGSGFPVVKLVGYDKPATIQVFIGTDQGRLVPHMFYQACQVSGKNSTPCVEKKVDGTVIIEIEALPEKDMTVTCDCVGILKERNVDVEHRFPEESPGRSKKKSTRCRMVFSTTITLNDGSKETLQVFSLPIVCTQPPGIPEIGKKSLNGCLARGGLELFILGKNFLKDTKVIFQEGEGEDRWEAVVQPDREYLQQSRLVCTVPPYKNEDIQSPVTVQLLVTSGGKSSESHDFSYLPTDCAHVAYYDIFPLAAPSAKLNIPDYTKSHNLSK